MRANLAVLIDREDGIIRHKIAAYGCANIDKEAAVNLLLAEVSGIYKALAVEAVIQGGQALLPV